MLSPSAWIKDDKSLVDLLNQIVATFGHDRVIEILSVENPVKMYLAGIYCPYEGGASALGIFDTAEAAYAAAPFITENVEFFRKRHQVFHVSEFEVNNAASFALELERVRDFLKYWIEDQDTLLDEKKEYEGGLKLLEKY